MTALPPRTTVVAAILVALGALTAACGSAPPPVAPGMGSPATSASSATVTATATAEPAAPTPTDGPCRCSWDKDAASAPRVCKRGEPNYEGTECVSGSRGYKGRYRPKRPYLNP